MAQTNPQQQHEPIPLRYENGSMVIPGDRIISDVTECVRQATSGGETKQHTPQQQQRQQMQYIAGEGTYIRNGYIVASIAGRLSVSSTTLPIQRSDQTEHQSQIRMITISVIPRSGCFRAKQQVIHVGQTILGRVVRISMAYQQQQQVMVDIVANPYGVLDSVASGSIRREDVTKLISKQSPMLSTTDDHTTQPQSQQLSAPSLQMSQSFRVGDWIVAKVVYLGDGRYYLTTAESSLGVVYATCATSRQAMIPISNREMECPVSGVIERRKCARPPINVT